MLGSSLSALSATSIATGLSPAAPGTSMPPLSCSPVPEVMAPASCSSQASVPQLPAGTPAWIPRADSPTQPVGIPGPLVIPSEVNGRIPAVIPYSAAQIRMATVTNG
ncbi:hypothetical protein XENTR_v10017328 [Xenopus tropicalis]|nr:hypothetical protein XENTR_v10017328 [Xenopus tropicalis]